MKRQWAALLLVSVLETAAGEDVNPGLRALKDQDQKPRADISAPIDWAVIAREDAERRRLVDAMLRNGEVRTSEDFSNAALIFQHGESVADIRLAYALASIAVRLDISNHEAKWLTAAAWDRLLMYLGKPQWYGTQFVKPSEDAPWQLYQVDESAVSDSDRKELGVPPLSEAKARAATIR